MDLTQSEAALAGVRFLNGLSRRQLLALVAANVLQGAGADLTADGLKTAVGDSKFLVGAGEETLLALAASTFITANGGTLASQADVNAALHDARFLLGLPGAELAAVAAAAYFGSPGGGGGFLPWTWGPDSIGAEEFWAKIGYGIYNQAAALSGVTDLTYEGATNEQGFDIEQCKDLISFRAPNLTAVTGPGGFFINGCDNLSVLEIPSLSILQSNFVATNCGLSEETVNGILAVLAAATSDGSTPWGGVVTLNGGTSAAASGQGLTDKATIIGRGGAVTTN